MCKYLSKSPKFIKVGGGAQQVAENVYTMHPFVYDGNQECRIYLYLL